MIAKNNEEKRNQIWRTVMTVTTVLIIIIAAFFIIKLFTANPLEGRWVYQDSNLVMTVKGTGAAIMEWPEEYSNSDVSVVMTYTIDKDTKTFTLTTDETAVKKAADSSDNAVTVEKLDSALSGLEGTYDYNIEQHELTLTDREYGNQMIFDKK